MSVVAAPAAGENEARAARLVTAGLLAGAGVLATLFTYQVSWNSTTLSDPHLNAISRTLLVAAWVGVGLSMAWWRVEPGLAVLVAGAGFLFAATGLNALDNALAYTVGRVLVSAVTVFIAYVSLRVVNDRLGTPLKRWFIGGLSAALVVLWALLLPIGEKLPSAGQFSYCGDRCPPNALNVVDWPGPARVARRADHGRDGGRAARPPRLPGRRRPVGLAPPPLCVCPADLRDWVSGPRPTSSSRRRTRSTGRRTTGCCASSPPSAPSARRSRCSRPGGAARRSRPSASRRS